MKLLAKSNLSRLDLVSGILTVGLVGAWLWTSSHWPGLGLSFPVSLLSPKFVNSKSEQYFYMLLFHRLLKRVFCFVQQNIWRTR